MAPFDLDMKFFNWQDLQALPSAWVPGLVFLASLLGSVHCAGMCGPLVVIAGQNTRHPWRAQLTYHFSRLAAYLLLGAISGLLGRLLLNLRSPWITGTVALFMAGMFLWMGWNILRGGALHLPLPPFIEKWQAHLWRRSQLSPKQNSTLRPLTLGLLTPLLPCGWLYAFILGGVASAGPLHGAVMMTFFWMGTLPALLAVHSLAQQPLGWLRRRHRWLAASLLIAAGLVTLTNRFLVPCH